MVEAATFSRPNGRLLAAVIGVLVAAILAAGAWLGQRLYHQAHDGALDNLRAVSALKTRELGTWANEKVRSLTFPAGSTSALLAERWLASGGADRRLGDDIARRMDAIRRLAPEETLAVHLHDATGRARLSGADTTLDNRNGLGDEMFARAAKERRAVLGDLHLERVGGVERPMLDVVTPLFVERGGVERLVGFYVHQLDPALRFFPMVTAWPATSVSAEVLLFRVEGGDVVYLSPLRHRPDAMPLTLRIEVTARSELLASQHVVLGRDALTGRDYRGTRAVGIVTEVPGTSWRLMAKIDESEIFASARRDAVAVGATTLVLLLALALVVGHALRAARALQRAALAEESLARSEAEERFEFLVRYAKDIVLLLDYDTNRVVDANEAALQAYGYTLAEMQSMTGADLRAESMRERFEADLRTIDASGVTFESLHRRKDGGTFPVEINARVLKHRGRFYRQGVIRDISERREAERRLRESEERYREIVESDIGEICRWSVDTTLTFVNKAYATAHDTAAAALVGRRWIEFVPEPERAAVLDIVADLVARPRRHSYEHPVTRAGGEVVWMAWTDIPELDAAGRLTGFQSIGIDITARKAAEAALLESESRFRTMFDGIEEGVCLLRIGDGGIFSSNRSMQVMFGRDAAALDGLALADLGAGTPGSAPVDAERMVAQAAAGEMRSFEWHARRGNDTLFWSAVTLRRVCIGSDDCILVVVRDVTDQRSSLAALVESEERFHAIVDNISEAVFIQDIDSGAILSANHAATALYGASERQLIAATVADLSEGRSPYGQDEAVAWAGKAAAGEPQRFEWHARSLTGRLFWVEVFLRRATLGSDDYILAVVRDIDESRAQREALQRNLEEQRQLLSRIEETQNQLLQSEKMSAIGQLAAGVAHEINNPVGFVSSNLGTLVGYVEDILDIVDAYEAVERDGDVALARARMLKEEKDYAYVRRDIHQLLAESSDGLARVRKIVQDLKDFSRVGEAEWQWADLRQGLDSTLNIVWHELKYHCTVKKNYGELPRVWCLPSQINQVFMNLLVNAAQAIEGRGEIAIACGRDGDDWVWISVADTGKGIAKENLKRIFDPFFTTKPVGKGTGLGLSLAYGIVQRHGGRIKVTSEVGIGTTFKVMLPVKVASDTEGSEAL